MPAKRLAYLCPGQGVQHVGMGVDLAAEFPVAARTFAEADDALGFGLRALCANGPDEALTLTANAQPALLTVSVAIGRILESEAGLRPDIAAGHSLGEWSAWVLAGALDFAEAVRAVHLRGRFMQEAVAPGVGAMSALLGVELSTVRTLCEQASRGDQDLVVPANLNGGGQIVVAGHATAVARLEELATAQRIRCSTLKVSAPFHSPLMAPAARNLAPTVESLTICEPGAPVVSNVEAVAITDPSRIGPTLIAQIVNPVRWEECMRVVTGSSEAALEIGSGRVLTGLARRIERSFPCRPTGDVEGVRAILADPAP